MMTSGAYPLIPFFSNNSVTFVHFPYKQKNQRVYLLFLPFIN